MAMKVLFCRRERDFTLNKSLVNSFACLRQTNDLPSFYPNACRIRTFSLFLPQKICLILNALGDGSCMGVRLSYQVKPSPDGLAQAFILGESFIGNVLVLWCGTTSSRQRLSPLLKDAVKCRTK